ncbi:MAG: flagellar basal body rod protein FlgB [Bryobacteraceae bacterium]
MNLTPLASQVETYMDLVSIRQKLVASNIANAATPGYKTRDIDFQFEFQSALDDLAGHAHGGSQDAPEVNVYEPDTLKAHNDGNNVNLDREARLLSENAIRFNFATQVWKSQMRQVRSAIQEGRNG